ncbi:MAG: molybdate ABC transporter substrate-binding protein [Acidobacteria bacterium]|nr:molybdate ABC transporter substrate-binding protein [Acidobacteriota bacterium]
MGILVLMGGVLALTACSGARATSVLRVAAAADLKFALDEAIATLRARDPDLDVQVAYGSSGTLHAQLGQRAPYDLFLSADVEYPRDLVARGIGTDDDLFLYAVGRIVVWVPSDSTLPIERDGLRALEGAERIALANPRHAPYGRAAEAAMRRAELWDLFAQRLVLGENVAQAAQFIQSGAADAGVIAKSLAVTPRMRGAGRFVDVPEDAHPRLVQGGLILPWAVSREAADGLRELLLSAEGRRLLTSYGFDLPPR